MRYAAQAPAMNTRNPLSNAPRWLLALLLAAFLPVSAASAVPEPSPVPRAWEFEIRTSPLRIAEIDVPGEGRQSYYFMTYTVTNNTGEDRLFAPIFELAEDPAGTLRRSGQGVPLAATQRLMERLGNPLLEDQVSIIGTLRQGEENARDGLAMWPAEATNVKSVAIYVFGLSGESRQHTVRNPDTGEHEDITLRKTLMLRHRVPGELPRHTARGLPRYEQRWILRQLVSTVDAEADNASD